MLLFNSFQFILTCINYCLSVSYEGYYLMLLYALFEPGMSCQLYSFTSFHVCVILANKMLIIY